ncbi:hypothetical protein PMAYCL1PPCAC_26850, partial [Pristionchus mayeri]
RGMCEMKIVGHCISPLHSFSLDEPEISRQHVLSATSEPAGVASSCRFISVHSLSLDDVATGLRRSGAEPRIALGRCG